MHRPAPRDDSGCCAHEFAEVGGGLATHADCHTHSSLSRHGDSNHTIVSASSATGRRRDRRGVVVPCVRSRRSSDPSARSTANLIAATPAVSAPTDTAGRTGCAPPPPTTSRPSQHVVPFGRRHALRARGDFMANAVRRPPAAGDGVRRARQADPLRQAAPLRLPARQRQFVPIVRASSCSRPASRSRRSRPPTGPSPSTDVHRYVPGSPASFDE